MVIVRFRVPYSHKHPVRIDVCVTFYFLLFLTTPILTAVGNLGINSNPTRWLRIKRWSSSRTALTIRPYYILC